MAKALKVELREFPVRDRAELAEAFKAMSRAKCDGVLVGEDPEFNSRTADIAALAVGDQLPAIGFTRFADGLLGYGADRAAVYARAGYFVDRMVKGDKPGGIPFERASKFELVVNLKTASSLGLRLPAQLLNRADRKVE